MANRYWVGGSGNWSDDDNHWATSTGGSPGNGNVPTSSDNVFIDSNSGLSGGTITLDVDGEFNDFTSTTGFSYTIGGTEGGLRISGSVILESGLTISGTIDSLAFLSTSTGQTITSNTCVFPYLDFDGVGGGWTLQDNLTVTGEFYQENGTFDANDHNVTASDFSFYANTGKTPTVIMGSGTWEATIDDMRAWDIDENKGQVVTITPETSTIKIGGSDVGFVGGAKTYNNLWIYQGIGNEIDDSNTFNDFKITEGVSVFFVPEETTTVSSFTAVGTSGNLITLDSSNNTDQFTLSKSSGVVSCDYLDISNSNTTGGALWYAGRHSADTTNNDGWIFNSPTSPLPTFLK